MSDGTNSGGNYARLPHPCETWGIYVYFAADVPDPDMQAAVWSTLKTLASVGSSDCIKITAMIDLPCRNTEYYIIPQKPSPPKPCKLKVTRWPVRPDRFSSNVNTASINAIKDFFAWSYRNCPADNIALVFWGHGYALDDFDPRREPGAAAGNKPSCGGGGKNRSATFFPGDSGEELKLLYDHTHKTILNNRDFAQAVGACALMTPKRMIQVIGLDCCNMAMAEVLSELQNYAEYAVVAETGLPYQPWLSASVLKKFLKSGYTTPRAFAVGAVKDFIGSFSHSADSYIELSACNLKEFGNLETAVKNLVDALLPAIEKYRNRRAIARAWFNDVSFVPDGLIDLSSFCKLLSADPDAAANVRLAAAGVQAAVGKVVVSAEKTPNLTGRRISLSKGLSIWFPPWIQFPGVRYVQLEQSKDYLFCGYPQIRFATATGWNCFLYRLLLLTQGQIFCRRLP